MKQKETCYFKGLHFLHWVSRDNYIHRGDRSYMDYYTLQYLKAGRIWLQIDNHPREVLTAPAAWMTFPGPRFRYGNFPDTIWSHSYVAFSGPRAEKFVDSGLFPSIHAFSVIPLGDDTEYCHLFESLLIALNQEQWKRGTHLLEGLLLEMQEPSVAAEPENSLDRKILVQAHEITRKPEAEYDFHRISSAWGISYDYFRHRFKLVCHKAPGDFLLGERLKKGSSLLRTTGLPVKMVAAQSGIDDIYYFTKLFKRSYQLPPGRYRKEFRED